MAPVTNTKAPGAFTPGNTALHRYVEKKMDKLFWGSSSKTPEKTSKTAGTNLPKLSRQEELLAKKERCNTRWNKFLNFFGKGEKMTYKEDVELSAMKFPPRTEGKTLESFLKKTEDDYQ